MTIRWVSWWWLAVMGCCLAAEPPAPEKVGAIRQALATEISGVAPSQLVEDLLWTINDSGHPPLILGFTPAGELAAHLHVTEVTPKDWEDLASFKWRGKAYLVVAEIGDNKARRPVCSLYVIEEPTMPPDHPPEKKMFVNVAWTIRFRYPDGPRDAESLAVDTEQGRFYILSKRATPPTFYALPLEPPAADEIVTAESVGIFSAIKEPLRRETSFFPNQPTAMDFQSRGEWAAVLTYQGLYLLPRHDQQSWIEAVGQEVEPWPLPPLFQPEAVCFSRDGRFLFVTSEKLPAPVYRWRLPAQPQAP